MQARPGARQRIAAKSRTRSATWSTRSTRSTGKIKWEREAIKTRPFGGRHRKNTYASETPFTDGERLYVSFGQNVGLFVLHARRHAALEEAVGAAADLSRLRHRLVADRLRRTRLPAAGQREPTRPSPRSTRRPARRSGARRDRHRLSAKSSWMTPFVWKNAKRTEIVTTGHGDRHLLRPRRQGALARDRHVDADRVAARRRTMCSTSAPARRATRTARSSPSSRAPSGDITLKPGRDEQRSSSRGAAARVGLHAVGARARGPRLSRPRHRHPDRARREDRRSRSTRCASAAAARRSPRRRSPSGSRVCC